MPGSPFGELGETDKNHTASVDESKNEAEDDALRVWLNARHMTQILVQQSAVALAVALAVIPIGFILVLTAYGVYERVSLSRMRPATFKKGYVALTGSEFFAIGRHDIPVDRIVQTPHGQFKFIADDVCLFSFQVRPLFGWNYRNYSQFPIKGTIRWTGQVAHVEGRIPITPMLHYGAMLVLLTSGLALATFQRSLPGAGISLLALAYVVGVGVSRLWFERRRAWLIVQEIKEQVSSAPSEWRSTATG